MTTESVLITGSSGFIGTALAERLIEKGYTITGVDRDPNSWSTRIENRTEKLDLLSEDLSRLDQTYDVIVHLAAHSRVGSSIENTTEATENVRITRNVLEFAQANNVEHVIFASSREVYGLNDTVIFEESDATPQGCANPYAASKLFGESLCCAYSNCYGLKTTTLRFTNVYGRYDDQNRVVPLFISQALAGDRLTVYGKEKLLDFVYIDDCIDGIERAIERRDQVANEAVNVGSGTGTSLIELACQVADKIDQCPGYDVMSEHPGEPTKMVADLDKSRALLGYEPTYDFEDGLAEAIAWYRNRSALTESIR